MKWKYMSSHEKLNRAAVISFIVGIVSFIATGLGVYAVLLSLVGCCGVVVAVMFSLATIRL